jgi:starch synthase (maltosyl-transferring)
VRQDLKRGHVVVEDVRPQIDCGAHRAKAVIGDLYEVTADIFRDGPAALMAVIKYRGPGDTKWSESPMLQLEDDRWGGSFRPDRIGRWSYTVEAWTDAFGTWRRDFVKRVEAAQDVDIELEEGLHLIEARLKAAGARDSKVLKAAIEIARSSPKGATGPTDPRAVAILAEEVAQIMTRVSERKGSTVAKPVLELTVDRERARFGAWYELFPRSSATGTKHGTFQTARKELARIADMGFDVVYLPPIHPIGKRFRKGRNNTLDAAPSDVGSPWAIGSAEGGHTEVNPQLGTLKDFDDFVAEADRLGLEIALDFAIQSSPDHPWVTEHPEWFNHRPDGSIRYAENPPKKYQDIYPINFDTEDKAGLWNELRSVLDHWIDHGVKIFRVDNPHTKSFSFWEWVIDDIQTRHPDVILLAEAFTRPKVMKKLAKLGFTQSYTYFTWRNTKHDLMEYMLELTQTEMAHYFRPNFFVNTPDILHEYLQTGGPPAFKVRLLLAALLSPSYGVYSGYELYENVPVKWGSEEYLNSEKFELRPREWSRTDSLAPYMTKINDIRRKHPALHELTNISFHQVDKDSLIAFSKTSPGEDPILVIANLNPFHWEEGTVHLDATALGIDPWTAFEVHDLITDTTFMWNGPDNYIRLDPYDEPAHVFRVRG